MADHPTPPEEEDIIEQTIHRELARQKLPSTRPQASFEEEEPPDEVPEPGHEAPAPAARWSTYLLPCFTVLFGAAFCILLTVYLTQLHQDNARYAQLGETLTAIDAMSRNFDSMDLQIDELERQLDIEHETASDLATRYGEAETEAVTIGLLYRIELFMAQGDLLSAAIEISNNSPYITGMEEYLEEYDPYYEGYYGESYIPLLPRYQDFLNTLLEEGYLAIETGEDGTQYLELGEEAFDFLASSTYPYPGENGEGD